MSTLKVEEAGSNATTSAGTPAARTANDRDAVYLLCVICVAATVLELLSWALFWFSTVASKRIWFYTNMTRREYIANSWKGKNIGQGKLPSLGGITLSFDYYRAFWVATRMPRYLSLVDVKSWIDENKEIWNQ